MSWQSFYNAAHMEQLCVMTCDKIMLMFGTGKYVDKAIDLKGSVCSPYRLSDGSGGK